MNLSVRRLLVGGVLFASATATVLAWAQDAGFDSDARPKSYIMYAAEAQTVPAGKSAAIELHFRVQDGFHVNSHTPKADFLIPTKLTLEPVEGVKAGALVYPAGTAYSFSFEPNEKLDVYSGAFTVKLPVVATAGEHKLSGTLRYQACDHAACYPPKTLAVEVLFSAK